MTVSGTVNKTGILLLLLVLSSSVTWSMIEAKTLSPWVCMLGGMIGGIVIGLITHFKMTWAPVCTIVCHREGPHGWGYIDLLSTRSARKVLLAPVHLLSPKPCYSPSGSFQHVGSVPVWNH